MSKKRLSLKIGIFQKGKMSGHKSFGLAMQDEAAKEYRDFCALTARELRDAHALLARAANYAWMQLEYKHAEETDGCCPFCDTRLEAGAAARDIGALHEIKQPLKKETQKEK